ncbi:hypothetical protein [Leptonema illini]|uniref:Prophage tail endopeptidase domain-containing protein n=1 Tax=Leptonema illini DSM 21528 TaxID=929563 RepID=H2CL68_9LEPT|nr:hypothetical protein [Leptonema illini]EHQ08319.1 hypothetical protein Lepil_3662 [Leptonema illini DSM 21528]
MLRMQFELTIGKFTVPYIVRAEWDQSRSTMVQEFKVILPYYKNISEIQPEDTVVFRCGYKEVDYGDPDGHKLPIEFVGQIYEIGAPDRKDTNDSENYFRKSGGAREGRLIEIKARDPLYKLRFMKVDQSWVGTNYLRMQTELFLTKLESYTAAQGTPLKVKRLYDAETVNPSGGLYFPLNQLQSVLHALSIMREVKNDGLGIDIYYRDGALILKDPGDPDYVETRVGAFVFGQNIIDDDLYARPGKAVKVTVRGYDPDLGQSYSGTYPGVDAQDLRAVRLFNRHEAAKGDFSDSSLKQSIGNYAELNFDVSGIKSDQAAKEKAMRIWEEIAGDGFQGNFTTFGWPRVLSSNPILIHDKRNPARTGLAIVNRVKKVFDYSNASYRQQVEPGYFPSKIENGLTVRSTPTGTPAASQQTENAQQRLSTITAPRATQFGGQMSLTQAIEFAKQAKDGKQ